MAGMYPDNQILELFGESVSWPGLDKDGKFTNGSFSDPDERPSFIPAETVNLILDNLTTLIISLGKEPNNKKADQLAEAIDSALKLKANATAVAAVDEALKLKANIANPAFTGTPKAPDITSIPSLLSDWGNQIVTMNTLRQAIRSARYPVGKIYIQLPSEPKPAEVGLLGEWVPWNDRPVIYGLSLSYPSTSAYSATATTAVAAGDYRTVTHKDGDQAIYQLITAKPSGEAFGEFDPVKWRPLTDAAVSASYRPVFRARTVIANHSWSTDLTMGATVTAPNDSGVNTTYRVTAIHSLSSKFLAGTGGNRPPFEGGGVHGDVQRPIEGRFVGGHPYSPWESSGQIPTALFASQATTLSIASGSGWNFQLYKFYNGAVIPIANENAPRNVSVNYWRRVA
jgi:hypothetical protein